MPTGFRPWEVASDADFQDRTLSELYVLQVHPPVIMAFNTDNGAVRTIIDAVGAPDGIQVDSAANAIYWTCMGALPVSGEGFFDNDGKIEKCHLDGSGHSVIADDRQIVTPKQLQLDREEDFLYWCDREGMAIFRCRTNGSEITELFRSGNYPEDMDDASRHCVGIAVDKNNRYLYWTQKGPAKGGMGRILRMSLDIPQGVDTSNRNDVVVMLDHLPEPIDLEIDHRRAQIYWTDRGDTAHGGNSVNRADITPEGLCNHQVLATGLDEGIGLALDVVQRRLFVGDLSGTLRSMSMDSGELSIVHRFEGPITGLCFDSVLEL